MCFSATASFALGGVLVPIGVVALVKARQSGWQWLPFALYPLAFGLQQICEGFVWIAMQNSDPDMLFCSSRGFLFYSHFFWPALAPISVWACEPDQKRKRWLGWLSVIGVLYGLLIYLPSVLIPGWTIVEIAERSLVYKTPELYDYPITRLMTRVVYAAIVLGALFSSTRNAVRVFALLIAVSLGLTFAFFAYAFISVWCFFAAILSIYLLGMILRKAGRAAPS
ncbi:DUF6629 family protein [uncultured Shimia sp.]|uniref:DUF6629 family protein n=1 Tax=uncultured Shimia sp. TaxID=573152 RepID=UPI0026097233|nr:DUF6629 family protein [uncultured Shimia sp.]